MAILCPYCGLNIELTGVKPGRFSPRCPKCREKFVLIVPLDASRQPEVLGIKTSSQTHVLPALGGNEEQTTLEETVAPPSSFPTTSSTSSSTSSSSIKASSSSSGSLTDESVGLLPKGKGEEKGIGETRAPSKNDEYFASKRAKYADWDEPVTVDKIVKKKAKEGDASEVVGAGGDSREQPEKSVVSSPTLSGRLGGYEITRKLGAGGMGAVYLAKQISLDRDVAVKVLLPQYAQDKQFVARFTREAYAAAQLTHHNVVQIHDIGAERETHFFSMELVDGRTLGEVVKSEGKLDPEVAVGYALQAARGLKFAHDHGMIHRDIKPDNLMLNKQGIVKVADLGLVKTPGSVETAAPVGDSGDKSGARAGKSKRDGIRSRVESHVTQANMVFGTPAFMAPEQAEDSTAVDQRADIYSLGCTLYHLLTGNPPFGGKTAMEVMTKHARQAVTPPDAISRHVPAELSAIVVKMMAKRPEDRYQDLGRLIEDFEAFLGLSTHGPFTPKEEHVRVLEGAADQFYGATAARVRTQLIGLFYGLCAVGTVTAASSGSAVWASGFVGLGLMTTLFYFVISGLSEKTYLFGKIKMVAATMETGEWIKAFFGVALLGAAVVVLGWHWVWLGLGVAAFIGAMLFHVMIDWAVRKQRGLPLRVVEEMLRSMRLKGLEEGAIRQFVCNYAGERWEAFFESLFGYEAKMEARRLWGRGDRGMARLRYRGWRDPIIAWADKKEAERRRERDQRVLLSVEVRALEAGGMQMVEARREAKKRAQRMVEAAAEVRGSLQRDSVTLSHADALPTRPQAKLVAAMISGEDSPEIERVVREHGNYVGRRFGGPLDWFLGGTLRFGLAAVLLLGFLTWRYQNKDWERITKPAGEVTSAQRVDAVDMVKGAIERGVAVSKESMDRPGLQKQLSVPLLPEMAEMLLSSWGAGLAGLILLCSVFWRGKVFGLVVLASAAIALLGPYATMADVDDRVTAKFAEQLGQAESFVQQANLTSATLSMAVALGVFVAAIVFLREKEGV